MIRDASKTFFLWMDKNAVLYIKRHMGSSTLLVYLWLCFHARSDYQMVGVKELSEKLNVPVSWIYEHTRKGSKAIPHMKIGKYVRFDLEEVMTFIKKENQHEE